MQQIPHTHALYSHISRLNCQDYSRYRCSNKSRTHTVSVFSLIQYPQNVTQEVDYVDEYVSKRLFN